MAFGVTGFAGSRLQPQPQAFQALSLGAQPPVPPSPPFGSPNQNLVPVSQSAERGFTANLTLAAQPVFAALLRLNPTIVDVTSPGLAGAPNTTSAVGAQNPSISQVGITSRTIAVSAPINTAPQSAATAASGTVTFSVNSPAATQTTIAVGTRVQAANGIQFTVVADANQAGYSAAQNAYVIASGQTRVNATVQAAVTGSSGNVAAQTITQFSSPAVAPNGVSVTNVFPFANGVEADAQSPLLENVRGAIASGAVTIAGSSPIVAPQAPISFSLTQAPANATSGQNALEQTLGKIANPTAPPPELDHELQKSVTATVPTTPSVPPSANPSAVARIVSTVNQLAASAVYPAPIFSFSA